jgi:hypothetical protein
MRANDSMSRIFLRATLLAFLAVALTGLVGCKSSPTRINGRVIQGTVGQAIVVGPNDVRLEDQGIPGVDVVVLHAGGSVARGRGVVGTATTDELGDFEIKIPGGKHPANSVIVRVKGEWVFSSRSQTYLPTNSQHLLCTVITRDGYTPPDQEEEQSTE